MATPPRETIAFAIHGPILRSDLPGLCDRVCAILTDAPADEALCDVRGVEPDALARLQLAARRRGCRVRLRNASPALLDLVTFMGLTEVLTD